MDCYCGIACIIKNKYGANFYEFSIQFHKFIKKIASTYVVVYIPSFYSRVMDVS